MLKYLKRILKVALVLFVLPLMAFVEELENEELSESLRGIRGITPAKILTLENNIVVTNLVGDSLLIGTDFGEVLEYAIQSDSLKTLVKLPDIKSFYAESYAPKVYSLDRLGGKILIHSEGDYGTKKLFVFTEGRLEELPNMESFNIKKAAFVDEEKVFLGLVSNEIVLYDLKNQQILYRKQLSEASFSDFALEIPKDYYVAACESGILYFGTIHNGAVLEELEGENKDNVYQVKFAHLGDVMSFITAGQDRNMGLYQVNLQTKQTTSYKIHADFLIYSVGISKDSRLGAYMQNEKSEIVVFEIASKRKIALLKGHTSLLNNIIFASSRQIISSEDGKNILIWKF
ncbi:nitrate reductase [Helicobacter sp. MIT 05-5294]|uniref:nitrate reductase n=1 Tax=Helicobacter sp. MIT 05-5294 TaxID=1548150 RepID=UPI000AF39C4E|nr:nitrate reductase [Helicobacter sp. MIT 05-5294]